MELSRPKHRKAPRKPSRLSPRAFSIGTVLLSIFAAGSFYSVCPTKAEAATNVLETLGISIAAGTVLGVSTLPFYDEPGAHTGNIGLGALIGAGVGAGILIAKAVFGNASRMEANAGTGIVPAESLNRFTFANNAGVNNAQRINLAWGSNYPRRAPTLNVPLVSLRW